MIAELYGLHRVVRDSRRLPIGLYWVLQADVGLSMLTLDPKPRGILWG